MSLIRMSWIQLQPPSTTLLPDVEIIERWTFQFEMSQAISHEDWPVDFLGELLNVILIMRYEVWGIPISSSCICDGLISFSTLTLVFPHFSWWVHHVPMRNVRMELLSRRVRKMESPVSQLRTETVCRCLRDASASLFYPIRAKCSSRLLSKWHRGRLVRYHWPACSWTRSCLICRAISSSSVNIPSEKGK